MSVIPEAPPYQPTISKPQHDALVAILKERHVTNGWRPSGRVLPALLRKGWVVKDTEVLFVTPEGREALTLPVRKISQVKPTWRSMQRLRNQKALVGKVEKYLSHARLTIDLWGFADLVSVQEGQPGTLYIQACITAHIPRRLDKMREPKRAARIRRVLAAGNRVSIWGWGLKRMHAGAARQVYKLTELHVTAALLDGSAIEEAVRVQIEEQGEEMT